MRLLQSGMSCKVDMDMYVVCNKGWHGYEYCIQQRLTWICILYITKVDLNQFGRGARPICILSPHAKHIVTHTYTHTRTHTLTHTHARTRTRTHTHTHILPHCTSRILIQYSERLSHLIFAAADIVLVPSNFEPCGLTVSASRGWCFCHVAIPRWTRHRRHVCVCMCVCVCVCVWTHDQWSKGAGILLHVVANILLFCILSFPHFGPWQGKQQENKLTWLLWSCGRVNVEACHGLQQPFALHEHHGLQQPFALHEHRGLQEPFALHEHRGLQQPFALHEHHGLQQPFALHEHHGLQQPFALHEHRGLQDHFLHEHTYVCRIRFDANYTLARALKVHLICNLISLRHIAVYAHVYTLAHTHTLSLS